MPAPSSQRNTSATLKISTPSSSVLEKWPPPPSTPSTSAVSLASPFSVAPSTAPAISPSRFGAEAKLWDQLETTIAGADLLITATSAPDPIIGRALVSTAMSGRPDRPLLCMDIALPRDVDPRVGKLPGVSLLDIDALQDVVDGTIAHRRSQVPAVERIVTEEMAAFEAWLRVRQAAPIISRMRRRVEDIGRGELERAVSRLGDLDGRERLVMERMVHSIVQKVLHEPTVGLREHVVNDKGPQYPWYIRELHEARLPSGNDKP